MHAITPHWANMERLSPPSHSSSFRRHGGRISLWWLAMNVQQDAAP
jgi:hypothetical protein